MEIFRNLLGEIREGNRLLYVALIVGFLVVFVFNFTDILSLGLLTFVLLIVFSDSEFFENIRNKIVNYFNKN